MTTMPMTETEFWSRLEYRVCREFEGIEECRRDRLWCDGFTPEDYTLTGWLRLDRESKHLEIAPGVAEAVEE